MESFYINSDKLQYNIQRGIVIHIDSHSSTSVGGVHGKDGSIVDINSSSTYHQKIFMRDAAGREFFADLGNWNITAMNGHELILIWMESFHNRNYALIYNKTLDIVYHSILQQYFKQNDDNTGCAILLIASVATLVFPATVASETKNNMTGWVLFLLMAVGTFAIYKMQTNATKTNAKAGELLKIKVDKILRHI